MVRVLQMSEIHRHPRYVFYSATRAALPGIFRDKGILSGGQTRGRSVLTLSPLWPGRRDYIAQLDDEGLRSERYSTFDAVQALTTEEKEVYLSSRGSKQQRPTAAFKAGYRDGYRCVGADHSTHMRDSKFQVTIVLDFHMMLADQIPFFYTGTGEFATKFDVFEAYVRFIFDSRTLEPVFCCMFDYEVQSLQARHIDHRQLGVARTLRLDECSYCLYGMWVGALECFSCECAVVFPGGLPDLEGFQFEGPVSLQNGVCRPYSTGKKDAMQSWISASKKLRRSKMDQLRVSTNLNGDPLRYRKANQHWRKYAPEKAAERIDLSELRWLEHMAELGVIASSDPLLAVENNVRFRTRLVQKFRNNRAYPDCHGAAVRTLHKYAVRVAQQRGEIDVFRDEDSDDEPLVRLAEASRSSRDVGLEELSPAELAMRDRPFEEVKTRRTKRAERKRARITNTEDLIKLISDRHHEWAMRQKEKVFGKEKDKAQKEARERGASASSSAAVVAPRAIDSRRRPRQSSMGSQVDAPATGDESEYDLSLITRRAVKGKVQR